jgi:hypothetical protein
MSRWKLPRIPSVTIDGSRNSPLSENIFRERGAEVPELGRGSIREPHFKITGPLLVIESW